MNLPKRVTDFLTVLIFMAAVTVAASVGYVAGTILGACVIYAFLWTLDRNVDYGINLEREWQEDE